MAREKQASDEAFDRLELEEQSRQNAEDEILSGRRAPQGNVAANEDDPFKGIDEPIDLDATPPVKVEPGKTEPPKVPESKEDKTAWLCNFGLVLLLI